MFEKNNDYTAISFEEGNYLTVEFAGVLKSSKNKESAMEFMNFILSEDFQSIIPLTNIMYPVNQNSYKIQIQTSGETSGRYIIYLESTKNIVNLI